MSLELWKAHQEGRLLEELKKGEREADEILRKHKSARRRRKTSGR